VADRDSSRVASFAAGGAHFPCACNPDGLI
jgi:hypothetical protein